MTSKKIFILLSVAFYAATASLLQAPPLSAYDELKNINFSSTYDSHNGADDQFENNCLQYVKGKMHTTEAKGFCSKIAQQRHRIMPEPDLSSWKIINTRTFNPSFRGRKEDNKYEVKIFSMVDPEQKTFHHQKIISGIKQQAELYDSEEYRDLIADLNKNRISLSFPVFTYTHELSDWSVAISSIERGDIYEQSLRSSLPYTEITILVKEYEAFFKRIGTMLAILDKHAGLFNKNGYFNILPFISSQYTLNLARIDSGSLVIPIAETESHENRKYRNFKTYVWFVGYENYKLVEEVNVDNGVRKIPKVSISTIAHFAVESFKTIRDSYFEFIRTNTDRDGNFHGTEKKPLMAEVDFEDLLKVLTSIADHGGIYSVIKTNRDVGFDPGKMNLDKLKIGHPGL